MNFGTSLGLALSSGINAYLPLLSFALAARLGLYQVNPKFTYVTNEWFLVVLAVLALADLFADKIPGLDHVWDAIHTVLRPIAGALVAAASSGQVGDVGLPLTMLAGGTLAGMTHATKAAVRVTSTTTTAGTLNTVISVLEDIAVVIGVILSLVLPIVMVILIIAFVILFLVFVPRIARAIQRRFSRKARAGAPTVKI